jgi:peroxiredoxin
MKKITGFVLLMISFISLNAQGLKVTGNLKNLADNTEVSLIDGVTNQEVAKSTAVNGVFTLTGNTENASIFLLSFKGMQQKIPLFIGNDEFSINGDLKDVNAIKFSGSASHAVYMDYMAVITPLIEPYIKSIQALQLEKDPAKKKTLTAESELQGKNVTDNFKALASKYNQSPVSTLFLLQFANMFPAIKEDMTSIYASFTGDAKKGPFAAMLDKTVASAEIGRVGSVLPEFTQNDASGKSVSLSSLRGKYVLIDFWASWCGPCRAENPNVVKAFNAYKSKGFTILGVSLDQDKAKWLEAIKKDGLTWTHVSDLKYWNNAVAKQFGIESIPANFLIDPNGVVIGKDLRGEELEKVLAKNIK